MLDDSFVHEASLWNGVGVHPTPSVLVRAFARAVTAAVLRRHRPGAALAVLDACAGDGRLGHAVAKRLVRLGFRPRLTLVEANPSRLLSRSAPYEVEQVVGDFFAYPKRRSFDVVVSNPPYLAVSRADAHRFGLQWPEVIAYGRNLYGLALAKCLSVCKRRGVVGLLAPHGWIRNWHGAGLRELTNCDVEKLDVYASSSRRLFPGVHQDVAAQIFELRRRPIRAAGAAVRISYDQASFFNIDLLGRVEQKRRPGVRVRVGPFVWNREKALLSVRAVGLPVIYGGNISTDGQIDLNVPRYTGRQFVAKTRAPAGHISTGPCLLIKRSLRGVPGDWKLDAAVVWEPLAFVAENHVIVVELPNQLSETAIQRISAKIVAGIEGDHRHHGHPNVSVAIVRQAIERSECELD